MEVYEVHIMESADGWHVVLVLDTGFTELAVIFNSRLAAAQYVQGLDIEILD